MDVVIKVCFDPVALKSVLEHPKSLRVMNSFKIFDLYTLQCEKSLVLILALKSPPIITSSKEE